MLGLPPRPRSPSSPMAVSSSTAVNVDPGDASPSKSPSDAGSHASDTAFFPCSPDANLPDCCDSSPASLEDAESQSATQLRSEEYRQLFRLPPEEALVEDFNCACQENILIQGHMYLFVHYICFYSNIFGFETKKIIRFCDITSVKRAKTAGIFPNAIEVLAGGKKHFFASFLSRDEAFRLIIDGCSQHGNGAEALMEKQDSSSGESSFRENRLEPGNMKISNCEEDLEISNREEDPTPDDSRVTPAPHNDNASTTAVPGLQDDAYHDEEQVQVLESQPSFKAWIWKVEDSDAPKITEEYTKVAESKFPIKVEEFFNLFFSDEDDAVDFIDSFHRKCGDKDFKCSSWSPHDQFGHARNVSFQHPIKIYLGAKFGSCQEMQKFKVYKNSQLVVETSQEINDVPYGDYFRVEGLWDVKGEDDGSCRLSVYINVAFSRRTMFKGKIVQSTVEECREAYAIFVSMAHDLLRERNIEKAKDNESINPDYTSITSSPNQEVHSERETNVTTPSKKDPRAARLQHVTGNNDHDDNSPCPENWTNRVSSALPIKLVKFWSDIRIQTNSQPLIAISFLVILLMQLSIVVLLARPQNIQIIGQRGDYMVEERASSPEMVSLLEKRIYNLKDEMLVVESWLERMRWEHTRLSEQLGYLEKFHNPTKRTD